MPLWRLIGISMVMIVAALSPARADWISEIASIGLSATNQLSATKRAPLLDAKVGTMSTLLAVTKAIPQAVKRQQDYNLGLGATFTEQALIGVSGWGIGKLGTAFIAPCFASGYCAFVGASSTGVAAGTTLLVVGAALDAVLASKIVEGLLDYRHEKAELIASEQQAKILQQRLDQQRVLQQLLHAQKSTRQWQDQRSHQLALQARPPATNAALMHAPASTQPTIPPTATGPGPGTSVPVGSPVSTGTPGSAGKSPPVGVIPNPGTASPIAQSSPTAAPPLTARPVTIGTPTDITTSLKQAQEIYDRMTDSGTTVAKPTIGTPTVGNPIATGTPATVAKPTTIATANTPVSQPPSSVALAPAPVASASIPSPGEFR